MSTYLEKMKELTLLLPENKTLYYRNMSVYNKANEDVKQALDRNANLLFTNELNTDSNFQKKVLFYLKNINLFILLLLVLMFLSFATYIFLSFLS
jgi:hypothetical protein